MLLADALVAALHRWGNTSLGGDVDGPSPEERFAVGAVAQRAQRAPARLVLRSDAAKAVHGLMNTRPSQLLSALPLCRLPFPAVWVEFNYADRRAWLAEIAGRGETPQAMDGTINPSRLGFLMESQEQEGRIGVNVEIVWDNPQGQQSAITAAGAIFIETTLPSAMPELMLASPTEQEIEAARRSAEAGSRVAEWIRQASELHAACLLARRLALPVVMPHHRPVWRHFENLGPDAMRELKRRVEFDLAAEWHFVLALLIALNSRNVLEQSEPVDRTTLNRQRSKKGKPPLLEHREIRLSLSKVQRNRLGAGAAGNPRELQSHLVMGHFKLRKSGVYWWSPHVRGSVGEPPTSRTYKVTDD